jgi:broad specificity phosphatase PhoE
MMGSLALVRHGQASFFADDYDKLSPLGEQQARLLGEFWVRRGIQFDEVYTGPRVRQIETAALAGEAFKKAGLEWPRPQMLPELDEHSVDRMMKLTMRQIMENHAHIGELYTNYKAATEPRDKHRTFQLMFEPIVGLWVEGKIGAEGVESWIEFQQRVRRGFKHLISGQQRGRRVAAFSSVGAITVCLRAALDCSEEKAVDLGWRVRNASVTDFVFSGDRVTLEGFNAVGHLEDPSFWTYR